MARRNVRGTGWLAVLALVAVACGDDCDESGCEAVAAPSKSKVETGIAGSVAISSDVVENGCQECTFATATLELWRTETLVTTSDERDAAVGAAADQTLPIDASYSSPLEPGNYLVCEGPEPCVSFQLRDGDLVTVNVKHRYGPTSFFVFDAQGKGQGEMFEFASLAAPE